jgi:putative acetyltransferase
MTLETIRDYQPDDQAAVLRIVLGVLAEFNFTVQVRGIEEDLHAIPTRYAPPRAGFWVAQVDEHVVGTVAVRVKSDTVCELKRLYVRPDHRSTGLGQRLYEHAEQFARAAGYTSFWLKSSRRFEKAQRLYERNGFTLLERLENDWEDNVYEKQLDGDAPAPPPPAGNAASRDPL